MDTQKTLEALDRVQVALDLAQSRVDLVQSMCFSLAVVSVLVAVVLACFLLAREP